MKEMLAWLAVVLTGALLCLVMLGAVTIIFMIAAQSCQAAEPHMVWPVEGRNEKRLDIYGPWHTWADVDDWEVWQGAETLAGPGNENGSSQDAQGVIHLKVWMRSTPDYPENYPIEATINGVYMCLGCPVEPALPIEPFTVGLLEASQFSQTIGAEGLYFPGYNARVWPEGGEAIWIRVPLYWLDQLALARGDSMYIYPDPCLVWHAALGFPLPEETP